jgi:hypothetical protein
MPSSGERCDALRVPMRVSVFGVDGRNDGSNRIEEELLELRDKLGAMDRHAGLVTDQGE